MKKLLCLSLIWLLVLSLAACASLDAASSQPPAGEAPPKETAAHSGAGSVSGPSAPPPASESETPQAPPASGKSGGIVYVANEFVYLKGAQDTRQLGPLPASAGHLALGRLGLAYIDGNRLQVLNAADGTTETWFTFPERAAQDYALRWSDDGLGLGYAVAWDEPDGSRMVELGVFEAGVGTRVHTQMAREAGATPTPPSMPPIPSLPGFANLHIVGFDGPKGHLAVTPAGGEERYSAVWFYDLKTLKLDSETLVRVEVHELALAPDQTRLAVARPGILEIWCLGTDAPPIPAEVPEGAHAARLHWSPDGQELAYLVNDGPAPGLAAGPSQGLWVWEGGQSRQVAPLGEVAALHGWTSDGGAAVLEVFDAAGAQTVRLVDVESGASRADYTLEAARVLGWLPE